jgi:hypothetical protein
MGQSMKSQREFCIESVLNEFPGLARPPSSPNNGLGRGGRVVERLNRVKQLRIDDTRRRVAQIEATIADFNRKVIELEKTIQAEEDRTGTHDADHFAYSMSAKAMIVRRDNLKCSIGALTHRLADTKEALQRSIAELFDPVTALGSPPLSM